MDKLIRADIAIIGGTGVYDPDLFTNVEQALINTKYGCVPIITGNFAGKEVAFLSRHGKGHKTPPHKINYKANIEALYKIKAKKIYATAAVGSLRKELKPGDFVILDQFIDFTKKRSYTFFDGDEGVAHIDLTEPYCANLRKMLITECERMKISYSEKGTYICTEGPRFETPAEIALFASWGCDVVGMTNVPEVILAREKELCYATIATVTNYGAGISEAPLTHKEVTDVMTNNNNLLRNILASIIELDDNERSCNCKFAAAELGKF